MKYCTILLLILCGVGSAQICAPIAAIAPNSSTSGNLGAANCTLADGTWFADYLIDFPSRGNWSASAVEGSIPLTLILRDESGARIDSGNTIQHMVERGTYHVLVNGPAANTGGNYTLSSKFSGTENVLCRHFAMVGTVRAVSGSLGPGSCKLPDGSAFDGYQLTIYGTGTVDVAIQTKSFTPLLILRTSDGHALPGSNSVDDNGTTHLNVPEIGNDTFTLVVAVNSPDEPGGEYTLSANFTPDAGQTCVPVGMLTASQPYSGSISPDSCNFNLPGREDFALFNFYNLHVDTAGMAQVSIDTADFSSLLLLLDADGNTMAEDLVSGGTGTPLIRQQLAPGDYRLLVFNNDSFGGSYSLNYQFTPGPAPPCPGVSVDSGSQVAGILSGTSSCKDSGFLADLYQITLPADGTVNLSLSSPDFSTFLDLHDGKDNDLTWGTESADGSASFFTADLPAGTYYVYAASRDLPGGYAFSYTFTAKALTLCGNPVGVPYNDGYALAQLGSGSCQGPDGRRADFYHFSLPVPATEAIFMLSQFFPTDVSLYRSDGTPLRRDQNSYADGNAVIIQYLAAGDYLVKARSADPTAEGAYELDFLFASGQPRLCSPVSLPPAGSISGQTAFTSCAWYDKTFADVYRIDVNDVAQLLTIRAESSAFDAFLILMDAKGNILATDDNSGGGTSALMIESLDPGTYYIAVKPADDPTSAGAYVLTWGASQGPSPSAQY